MIDWSHCVEGIGHTKTLVVTNTVDAMESNHNIQKYRRGRQMIQERGLWRQAACGEKANERCSEGDG